MYNIETMHILLLKTQLIVDDWSQQLFWTVAIVASMLLIILMVYQLFSEESIPETSPLHKPFIQLDARSVLIFFAVFGWAAALVSHFDFSFQKASIYGLAIGVIIVLLAGIYRLPHWFFQKNAEVILESTGKVLQSIPPHQAGIGKVHLNRQRVPATVNAVTQGRELPVGSPIRVIGMLDNNTLLVEPLDENEHPRPGMLD